MTQELDSGKSHVLKNSNAFHRLANYWTWLLLNVTTRHYTLISLHRNREYEPATGPNDFKSCNTNSGFEGPFTRSNSASVGKGAATASNGHRTVTVWYQQLDISKRKVKGGTGPILVFYYYDRCSAISFLTTRLFWYSDTLQTPISC